MIATSLESFLASRFVTVTLLLNAAARGKYMNLANTWVSCYMTVTYQ
jgi:hypothetical protein